MRFKITFILLLLFFCISAYSQLNDRSLFLDSSFAHKLSVSGFYLCQTTLADLHNMSDDFNLIDVEEMDLGIKCIAQDGRFENGKGYVSAKYPGMIFQKDQITDQISKI